MNRQFRAFLASFLYLGLLHANDPIRDFPSRVKSLTLPNGLRVLVVERPSSPSISFAMYLRTGGFDDESGKTGLAHMFEHMLFKGTQTIGTKNYAKEKVVLDKMDLLQSELIDLDKSVILSEAKDPKRSFVANDAPQDDTDHRNDILKQIAALEAEESQYLEEEEFWKIYERAGGTGLNASTGYDYTNYVISLPKNQLPLWAAMEADRLKKPVLREFYKERAVVLEERRMRTDNTPQGKLWEAFLATAFMAHPYGHPIVGWESDISRVTRKDAEKFFKDHYGIDRLVIAIVGGVSADEVFALVKKSFGDISAPANRPIFNITQEPLQEGERRVHVEFDAEPSLVMGYHRPDMHHPDEAALSVVERVLNMGRTGRFYKTIVQQKKIATSAWASSSFPGERDPNLFVIGGTPRPPHTVQDVEKAFEDELEKLKKEPVSDDELNRVRVNIEADLIRNLESNDGLAGQLAYYESVGGDWHYLFEYIERLNKVTAEDVRRAAQKYFSKSNKTVGTVGRKK